MNIYRYMRFDEFENAYLNKQFKFKYAAVWEDSLESLFVRCASSSLECRKLVNTYKVRYPDIPNNDIFTDITNIVALSLQTRCLCWCTNGNSNVFWTRNKDYICLGIEYEDSDEFITDYKVKGHHIQYIEDVDIERIIYFFERDRCLSNLQIVKDKDRYEEEEEYRLVATPKNPIFPRKRWLFSCDAVMKCDYALVESIVDYAKWAQGEAISMRDIDIPLQNIKITSIKKHPNMSYESFKQFNDFCNKHCLKYCEAN